MGHSLATLLWLSILIYACYVESSVGHQHEKRVVPTDLFRIFPEGRPGGCTQDQLVKLSAWISDATELHNAAMAAYGFGLGVVDAANLANIMGVNTIEPFSVQSEQDRVRFQFLGHRLSVVQQFLTGNGIFGYPGAKPFFYCNDGFAQYVPWDEPARDLAGHTIPNPERDNEPFTIATLFPDFVGTVAGRGPDGPWPITPFFIQSTGFYSLEPTDPENRHLCYGNLLAASPFPVAITHDVEVFYGLDIHINENRQSRYMFICPNGWINRGPYYTAMDDLAEITRYENYPDNGNRSRSLGVMIPVSATFYHELFHLTDTPNDATADPYMSTAAIFGAAAGDTTAKHRLLDNPESFTYFAVASYLVRNAPPTPPGEEPKGPVVFFGGIPVSF